MYIFTVGGNYQYRIGRMCLPLGTKQYRMADQYRLTASSFLQIRHFRVGIARSYMMSGSLITLGGINRINVIENNRTVMLIIVVWWRSS